MRIECAFIFIVLRMTTSFFVPVSFHRCSSKHGHGIPRSVLWMGNVNEGGSSILSLDSFVSVIEKLDKNYQTTDDSSDAVRIVSRGSSDLPPSEKVETTAFYDPSTMGTTIVIVDENSGVDVSKVRHLCSNDNLIPVPADMVQHLCGFAAETLPPLGHFLASDISSHSLIFDQRLIQNCQSKNLRMIGGAGHPYWKLLLTAGLVVRLQEAGEVRIADVTACDDEDGGEESDGRVWEVSSIPVVEKDPKKNPPTTGNTAEQTYPKPYFPIDGPPINIAQLVIRQKELSNPLTPVFLTVIGRIGAIKTRTKRSLRCEFLPPLQRKFDDDDESEDETASYPWKSAACNRDMAVDLAFGKVLLQNHGTKQGEVLIESIQEGQLVQIEAKTNPGQRESIEKWVDTSCLELTLMDCQLLSPALLSSGELPNGNKSKSGKQTKKVVGSSSSLPMLTLGDLYEDESCIKFVDDLESLSEFSDDITKLSSASSNGENPGLSPFVGIDCEWQPREFMDKKKQPQPVLLLQISLHALETVYILDLQTLLRPLQTSDTPMNDAEQQVSDCLSRVMNSEWFIKVGYQLSSDLRRVFASYPHLPCFQEVRSTVEISSFIKRVLQVTKQKKSRYITMSLASMASHYLEMSIDKEHQLTDWAVRDLTSEQLEYAALDAAVPAALLEKVLESIEAHVSMDGVPTPQEEAERKHGKNDDDDDDDDENENARGPVIRRHEGDEALAKEIVSMRFLHLAEHTDEGTVRKLRAKQYVGPSWIAASVWTAIQSPPPPLVVGR